MPVLRLVLGDQLTRSLSALDGVAAGDPILMVEVREETTYASGDVFDGQVSVHCVSGERCQQHGETGARPL